jgi:ethanolamine utilization protein EutQ (cupin superfamily)
MNLHSPIIPSMNRDQNKNKYLNQIMKNVIKEKEVVNHNGKIKYTWIPKNTKIDHPYQTPLSKETMG